MATIKEIAAQAGVSIATVSRVLNKDENMSVSAQTRERIFQIADQLGYTKHKKNLLAYPNRKKIAIIQWYTQHEELNDLYYYSIRLGIERRALELGYDLVRIFHDHPLSNAQGVDGIILIGKYSPSQITTFENITPNLVFVDSDSLQFGHSCVTTDFYHATRSVLDHFIQKNLTEIGMLVGQEWTEDKSQALIDPRFETFKSYLTTKKLYQPQHVYVGQFTSDSGYQLMKSAIETGQLPQAFFIASDAMAIGALRALQETSIPVPEKMSLIAFNDTAVAKQVYPALSCVTVFTEEMGATALTTLDQILSADTPQIPRMIQLGTKLTLRGSSI
ncbi:LacI family DNA-binding transcriptional regulator [Streptococcus gallolyticus]|uniref:LacI family DNA-binding transcriptional regulator n=1 Tax=Streptococcus hepaticus TaxID=3349163 RepID=UPI001C937605|nr:LacI family DNA-binding transcriptional regulator [Streptococcus gallolyticus]MBY5041847.1 LacI family DNA-binding transcriptional regulator [Streptococcus gallolyticus]